MMPKICEWKNHKGDKTKNHGEGVWWLKDQEWVWLCPNCNRNLWEQRIKKWMKKSLTE